MDTSDSAQGNGVDFFKLMVPTADTVCYSYLLDKLLGVNRSCLLTGPAGVGKTAVVHSLLQQSKEECGVLPQFLIFS